MKKNLKELLKLEMKKKRLYMLLERIESKIEEVNFEIDHLLEDDVMEA